MTPPKNIYPKNINENVTKIVIKPDIMFKNSQSN